MKSQSIMKQSLDKIDLDMEIADPPRSYHPQGLANKLFDKDSQGA